MTPSIYGRPRRPTPLHKWYSVCGKHQHYRLACHYCQGGKWYFEPFSILGRLHYRIAPKHWIRWANR